jgi:hypothetical protein
MSLPVWERTLKIAPGKNPGVLKVRVEKDYRKRTQRKYSR